MYEKCEFREKCMIASPVGGKGREVRMVSKSRAELDIPCGFELARSVKACPKWRKMQERMHGSSQADLAGAAVDIPVSVGLAASGAADRGGQR